MGLRTNTMDAPMDMAQQIVRRRLPAVAMFWCLVALLAAIIWAARCHAVARLSSQAGTSGFEEISLFNLSQVRAGEPAYADCFSAPYRTSLFNWLFYQSYGAIARAFNPDEGRLGLPLRIFTACWAALGFAATLSLLWPRRGEADSAANPLLFRVLAVSVAWVAWFGPVTGWWTLTARPDVAAAACEALALAVVAMRPASASVGHGVAAGILFFLGWSFKQSAVGIMLGTLAALLWHRNWKTVLAAGTVFGGLVLATWSRMEAPYWSNVLVAPRLASWTWAHLGQNLAGWLAAWGLLLCLLPFLDWRRAVRGTAASTGPSVRFLTIVFAVALVIAVPASARSGSSRNYYFAPWVVGLTLLGTLQIQFLRAGALARGVGRGLPVAYVSALLICLAYTAAVFLPNGKLGTVYLANTPVYSPELLRAVRASARPLYIDDPNLVRCALGDEARTIPVIEDTIYWDAQRAGLIKDEGIEKRLETHHYETLWLANPTWRERAEKAGYREQGAVGDYVKYVPPVRLARARSAESRSGNQ
jgi:hypothetical protein